MAATIQTVRADLTQFRSDLDTWPEHPAVIELRESIDAWISQLDAEDVEGFAERFERAGRVQEQIQHVVAILEEWDA